MLVLRPNRSIMQPEALACRQSSEILGGELGLMGGEAPRGSPSVSFLPRCGPCFNPPRASSSRGTARFVTWGSSPESAKTYGKGCHLGPFHRVFGPNQPNLNRRPETLRILLAPNPPWAQSSPKNRCIEVNRFAVGQRLRRSGLVQYATVGFRMDGAGTPLSYLMRPVILRCKQRPFSQGDSHAQPARTFTFSHPGHTLSAGTVPRECARRRTGAAPTALGGGPDQPGFLTLFFRGPTARPD